MTFSLMASRSHVTIASGHGHSTNHASVILQQPSFKRIHGFCSCYNCRTQCQGTDGLNYALTTATPEWLEGFFARKPAEVAAVQVDLDPVAAVVPVTVGPSPSDAGSGAALAVAFGHKQARAFLQATLRQAAEDKATETDFAQATSTQVMLSPAERDTMFQGGSNAEQFAKLAADSPAVGFVFVGSASAGVVAKAAAAATSSGVYASPNSVSGEREMSAWESILATRTS